MTLTCCAPVPAAEAHTINEGDRYVHVTVSMDWGAADLRDKWSGEHVFCSFKCLADWAGELAGRHDNHVLVEGTAAKE